MATRIKYRRDTAANWAAANPVLAAGEPGYEVGTKKLKIGDGVTAWNALAYQAPDETALTGTYVRFEDEAGNPLTARTVVIKVSATTGEIIDIISEV